MTIYGDVWRKVHGTVTGKPDNFSWILEGKLAGSAIPTSFDEEIRRASCRERV